MALSDYQQKVEAWVQQYRIGYWKPHEILTRLTEETGEVAREVNHEFGPKKKKPDERVSSIGGELADVIFTV
ncbi:MAG TPA: MazG nucleotide pyrophosphohydrolase domain-containing protein, partial [Candidatus Nanoarchaeia archaeon]|nr:MazG nucleotide pyrophosphohydrolase domain-containing protein [Candidatus Nanoarchaeia archaeon]